MTRKAQGKGVSGSHHFAGKTGTGSGCSQLPCVQETDPPAVALPSGSLQVRHHPLPACLPLVVLLPAPSGTLRTRKYRTRERDQPVKTTPAAAVLDKGREDVLVRSA